MAAGDPISAQLSALGWDLHITFENMDAGGDYLFGLDAFNNPINARVTMHVTRPGYSQSTVLGTVNDLLFAMPCEQPNPTGAMRKAAPNQASPDETADGDNLVIRVAMSEFVFTEDTNITLDIDPGFYNDGTTASRAVTGLAVTNNSTLSYATHAQTLGDFAILKGDTIVGTSFPVEAVAESRFARNGQPVACVKFVATDGTHSVEQIVSSFEKSPNSPYGKILCYRHTFDLSTFTDLAAVTCHAYFYPWAGTAGSVRYTGDGVNTFPSPGYCSWKGRIDKTGKHGHVVVDPVGGNDTTGTVYATQSAAEAGSACLTFASAMTKLQAYHNTNCGHNDAGGGTVYFPEGTHDINSQNGGTMTTHVRITRKSTASKAATFIRAGVSNAILPYWSRIDDVSITGSYIFNVNGATTKSIAITNCSCSVTTATNAIFYTQAVSTWINNTGQFGQSNVPSPQMRSAGLIRGCESNTYIRCVPYVCIGNRNISPSAYPAEASSEKYNDGAMIMFNTFGALSTIQQIQFGFDRDIVIGFAVTQNLILRYTNTSEPLVGIAMDSGTANTRNVILRHNTASGGRWNLGYDDLGTTKTHTTWCAVGNIWRFNNKDDTFPTADGTRVGGWAVGYGVGFHGNHYVRPAADEWNGENQGIYRVFGTAASALIPEFVQDNSYDGANTSGGDYHLTEDSPGIGLVHLITMAYDLEGAARGTQDSVGCYSWEVSAWNSPGIGIPAPVMIGTYEIESAAI